MSSAVVPPMPPPKLLYEELGALIQGDVYLPDDPKYDPSGLVLYVLCTLKVSAASLITPGCSMATSKHLHKPLLAPRIRKTLASQFAVWLRHSSLVLIGIQDSLVLFQALALSLRQGWRVWNSWLGCQR